MINIININSNIEITHSQKSFIKEVLFCGDDHHMIEEDSFYCLSREIPIFLINEDSMKKYDTEDKYKYEKNLETKP